MWCFSCLLKSSNEDKLLKRNLTTSHHSNHRMVAWKRSVTKQSTGRALSFDYLIILTGENVIMDGNIVQEPNCSHKWFNEKVHPRCPDAWWSGKNTLERHTSFCLPQAWADTFKWLTFICMSHLKQLVINELKITMRKMWNKQLVQI